MPRVPGSRLLGAQRIPGVPAGALAARADHRDAVDRADRHAQLAAGAELVDDDVHSLGGADDRIDRACLQAERTADAPCLVDPREGARRFGAAAGVERQGLPAGEAGEAIDAFGAAGRAAVDLGALVGDRFGVAAAVVVAAAAALRLRQQREHRLDRRAAHGDAQALTARRLLGAGERFFFALSLSPWWAAMKSRILG